jgi:hypothetical protein
MMNKHASFRFFLPLGFVLALAGVLFAQSAPNKSKIVDDKNKTIDKNKVLVVNGKSAGPVVRKIDGRSYVDIETLSEVTNGVVTFERYRVILTIPVSDSGATDCATPTSTSPADAGAAPDSAPPADAVPVATAAADVSAAPARTGPAQPPQGLSRDFASAGIAALAEMREMQGAIRAMITYGLAVSDTWTRDGQGRVTIGLQQAQIAATTEDDQHALQLLQNEADKLESWADSVFAARQILDGAKTADSNALQNDPALAKIRSCGQFLSAMLVSGAFADDGSCH